MVPHLAALPCRSRPFHRPRNRQIWGELTAAAQLSGIMIPASDGRIAATALRHGLRLMTRNTAHFAGTHVLLLNPWETKRLAAANALMQRRMQSTRFHVLRSSNAHQTQNSPSSRGRLNPHAKVSSSTANSTPAGFSSPSSSSRQISPCSAISPASA